MLCSVVDTVMRSFSELPAHLAHIEDPLIMVGVVWGGSAS